MISIIPFIIIAIVFAIVQISIFKALPRGVRRYLSFFPPFAIIANFLGSFLILFFTGTAYFVGMCNLASSIIFGAYVMGYKKTHQINKMEMIWKWKIIPLPVVFEGDLNPKTLGGLF